MAAAGRVFRRSTVGNLILFLGLNKNLQPAATVAVVCP
jgi:hypothetical protein